MLPVRSWWPSYYIFLLLAMKNLLHSSETKATVSTLFKYWPFFCFVLLDIKIFPRKQIDAAQVSSTLKTVKLALCCWKCKTHVLVKIPYSDLVSLTLLFGKNLQSSKSVKSLMFEFNQNRKKLYFTPLSIYLIKYLIWRSVLSVWTVKRLKTRVMFEFNRVFCQGQWGRVLPRFYLWFIIVIVLKLVIQTTPRASFSTFRNLRGRVRSYYRTKITFCTYEWLLFECLVIIVLLRKIKG